MGGAHLHRRKPVFGGAIAQLALVAANWHTVAVKTDGTLWAWGENFYGQLGDGTTTDQVTPVQVGTDTHWASVAAGFYHTIGLRW